MAKKIYFHGVDIEYDSENREYSAIYQGQKWVSKDGEEWISSVTGEVLSSRVVAEALSTESSTESALTESQKKIKTVCDSMKDLLLYKNEKYGDSALHPNNVFYKGDSTNSIKIRLDDKIGRIRNCKETRINDVADIIGYCVLLLVSMDVSESDFEKLKD